MPCDPAALRKAVVLGVGDNGSGADAALALNAAGMTVTVTDSRPAGRLPAVHVARLAAAGIPVVSGANPGWLVDARTLVVPAPSVPVTHPYCAAAGAVLNDVALLLLAAAGPSVGITGSNGKTTVTAWLHHVLKQSPPGAVKAGNIGPAASTLLSTARKSPAVLVLEVSSYQAEYMALARTAPDTMLFTNFAPNHLDHYRSPSDYRAAKRGIIRHVPPAGTLILNADDEVAGWGKGFPGDVLHFGRFSAGNSPGTYFDEENLVHRGADGSERKLGSVADAPLPGRHNLYNFCAVIAAAAAAGKLPPEDAFRLGLSFAGVEHRMEFVAEAGGVAFYDDSSSTTPDSTLAALETFTPAPVLIVGGRNKGMPLQILAERLGRAPAVVLIGETAAELRHLIGGTAAVSAAGDMPDAVAKALAAARSAGAKQVILSPGFASFDMFGNYRERGEAFKNAARAAAGL
ncbi:MAG: UDP-N-acetylmuramoyl-L-alanine--D-glutamate ligase [Planctomycetes bacterium]|nr:UDP-N-acetylmuramoyl-L-alanine--D-glutamate ligase [Planctomycetota bacterium]